MALFEASVIPEFAIVSSDSADTSFTFSFVSLQRFGTPSDQGGNDQCSLAPTCL